MLLNEHIRVVEIKLLKIKEISLTFFKELTSNFFLSFHQIIIFSLFKYRQNEILKKCFKTKSRFFHRNSNIDKILVGKHINVELIII